jgi:hypothetical protein
LVRSWKLSVKAGSPLPPLCRRDIDPFEIETRLLSHSGTRTRSFWDVQICRRTALESGLAAQDILKKWGKPQPVSTS